VALAEKPTSVFCQERICGAPGFKPAGISSGSMDRIPDLASIVRNATLGGMDLFDQFCFYMQCGKDPQRALLVNIGKCIENRSQDIVPKGQSLSKDQPGFA